MASTYTSLHVHVIFSTRDRLPLIQPVWKERFILNQEQHHRKKSAEEEFRDFIARAESSGNC